MCYAKSTGKGRCDCDSSEKRKLRYHNKEALDRQSESLNVEGEGTSTPQPYLTQFDASEISSETVKEIAQEIQELKKKWGKLPPMSDEAARVLIHAESRIMHAGGIVSKLIEECTGRSPTEVARITNLLPRIELTKLLGQVNVLKHLERALDKTQATGDWPSTNIAMIRREKQQDVVDVARKSYKQFELSQLAINTEAIQEQAEAALLVLGEIREIGGKKIVAKGHLDALEQIEAVSRYMPSDWVDKTEALPKLIVGWGESNSSDGNELGFYQRRMESGQERKLNTYYLPRKLRPWEKSENHSFIGVKNLAPKDKPLSPEMEKSHKQDESATWIHEMTHRMEHAHEIFFVKMEETFLIRRTSVNGVREKSAGSGPELIIYEDAFARKYMGREYAKPNSWEVLTVGAESIFGAQNGGLIGVGDYKSDEDARRFILGAWATM